MINCSPKSAKYLRPNESAIAELEDSNSRDHQRARGGHGRQQEPAEAVAEAVAQMVEEQIETEREVLVTEDDSDKRVCYTIGPIKDKSRAIEISGRYSGNQITHVAEILAGKGVPGRHGLYRRPQDARRGVKTANDLSSRGISDHIIINQDDRNNLLSLGVFGLKKNADRLRARVEKMDYEVETEARYRERTIYWVYAEQSSEDERLQLLDDSDEFDRRHQPDPDPVLAKLGRKAIKFAPSAGASDGSASGRDRAVMNNIKPA